MPGTSNAGELLAVLMHLKVANRLPSKRINYKRVENFSKNNKYIFMYST